MNAPVPHTFDLENARELCALSAAAYQKPSDAGHAVQLREDADTHVLIDRRSPGEIIVAFRGTADAGNWLTDLDCGLIPVLNFRVHRGFYEAMQAVELDLDASLHAGESRRLWVTGHSLGGALAKLWALWAAGRGLDVAGVYTFGQPRVGDAAFATFYDSVLKEQSFRVVHADDIVPRIPWQLSRYRHAGHEVFFPSQWQRRDVGSASGGTGRQRQPQWYMDPSWPAKMVFGVPAFVRGLAQGKLAFLDDHHVNRYLELFPERRPQSTVSYLFHS